MAKRIKIQERSCPSIKEAFDDFLLHKKASGLAEKTCRTYSEQFAAICKHLDSSAPITSLVKRQLEEMLEKMRDSGLKDTSINSYTRTLKSFLSWCNAENLTDVNIKLYKCEDVIKETYSDAELALLLKKPDMKRCYFAEYRNWVIVNYLINGGNRARSIRLIQNKDVDLENGFVILQHTKNKRAQLTPLCETMVIILREYMRIRKGGPDDYLFPNDRGEALTENGLRCTIAKYNRRRGVQKTSLHMFRHTFARKYLVDCGGNAFTLQALLGHSTLDMTKKYCAIYNADLSKNFDNLSPLSKLTSRKKKLTVR